MNTPTVLITGALTGIGRAAALAFAREGARIVVSGRQDDKGKALVSELQELGAEATFIKLLRETNRSVIEIGLDVGYTSPSHFAQIFRREVGISPTEYRRLA